MRTNLIETEDQLRKLFWDQFPTLSRKKSRRTEARGKWVDWIDILCSNGKITTKLAQDATLD